MNIIFSTTDSSIEYILAAGWVSSTEQQPNDSHTQTQFPRIFYEKSSYEPSPFALRGTNLLPSFFTFLTFVFFQQEEGVMAVSVWKKLCSFFCQMGLVESFYIYIFETGKRKSNFFCITRWFLQTALLLELTWTNLFFSNSDPFTRSCGGGTAEVKI